MNKLQLSKTMMIATVLLIAAFQCYWIARLYKEEYRALQSKAAVLLKQAVQQQQASRVKNVLVLFASDKGHPGISIVKDMDGGEAMGLPPGTDSPFPKPPTEIGRVHFTGTFRMALKDSVTGRHILPGDSNIRFRQVVRRLDGIFDSLSPASIDSGFRAGLKTENIFMPYRLVVIRKDKDSPIIRERLSTGLVATGLDKSNGYMALFSNPGWYIVKKLTLPLIVAVLITGITLLSFILLYRNLLAQQQLAAIKNELISNISHELKTPIATVAVAIEALRNFDVTRDTAKTQEYLDISATELQRLSLLTDKVLRLSMFERGIVSLNPEMADLRQLVTEVVHNMQLQFEKAGATVMVHCTEEHFLLLADRLHLISVIYNLLDNAVKYGGKDPLIQVSLYREEGRCCLEIKDNGIGIPLAYREKIFEKFFRVPGNDRHNVKGYGLGLNYVAHIVQQHHGTIEVHSRENEGSSFIVKLPAAYEQH